MSEAINPYQSPESSLTGFPPIPGGACRSGSLLIVPVGAEGTVPTDLCLKCGEPAAKVVRKKLSWYPPWVYLLILAGVLVFAVVAVVLSKRMTVPCALCERHARIRFTGLSVAWTSALVGIGGLLAGIANEQGVWAVTGLGLILLSIIVGIIFGTVLRPTRIDDRQGSYKGAGEVFLSQLPHQ